MSQSQLSEDVSRAVGRSRSSSPRASQAPARVGGFFGFFFLLHAGRFFSHLSPDGGFSRLTAALMKASSLSCHVLRSWNIKAVVISRVGTQTKAF